MDNKPKKNICFITSLFSSYSDYVDKPGYFNRFCDCNNNNKLECDYFLFTNLDSSLFNTSWTIINIPFDSSKFKNLVVLSRYPKFMLWKIMEDYKEYFEYTYDIVVYCDAFLSPSDEYDWSRIYNFFIDSRLKKLDKNFDKNLVKNLDRMNNQLNFIQSKHHYKKIREGGIVEDAKMIISSNKDNFLRVAKTLKFFKDNGYGGVWLKRNGYVENTVFCYDLFCLKTRKFLQDFWNLYTIKEFTYRDQIIWNYLLIKQNKKVIIFDEETDLSLELYDNNNNNKNEEYGITMKDLIFKKTGEIKGHKMNYYSL